VLDELHTYRGRQGADVAMLVRRVRESCRAHDALQCIGTSATMASGDTKAEQRAEVARVASQIFGTTVAAEHVITETFVRATATPNLDTTRLGAAVRNRGDAESDDPVLKAGFDTLRADPLASWVEDTFGITEEPSTGTLIRQTPTTVERAAATLAELTGIPQGNCAIAIRATLLAGSRTMNPQTGRPLFAFRLHRFLSKGGTVFTTLEPENSRPIESEFQVELPGERRLFPLAFCRECGQEYLMAAGSHAVGTRRCSRPGMRCARLTTMTVASSSPPIRSGPSIRSPRAACPPPGSPRPARGARSLPPGGTTCRAATGCVPTAPARRPVAPWARTVCSRRGSRERSASA